MKQHGLKPYWFLVILTAILGTASDLFSKYLAVKFLEHHPIEIIPGILRLSLTHNSGIVWGLWSGNNIIFLGLTILTIPLILLLFWEITRQKDKPSLGRSWLMSIAFGLILSGAIGNLYDRLVHHAVRDFIDFYIVKWPIFNIADTYITIGALLIVILMFRRSEPEITPVAPTDPDNAGQPATPCHQCSEHCDEPNKDNG